MVAASEMVADPNRYEYVPVDIGYRCLARIEDLKAAGLEDQLGHMIEGKVSHSLRYPPGPPGSSGSASSAASRGALGRGQ